MLVSLYCRAGSRRVVRKAGRKRAQRGRSGAVRPVNWGHLRTTAVKIKNTYGQVNRHFHAQTRTCPASLPSWPCRFDPGHPLHRKTLTQQGFSRAHGRRVLLKRRSWVPSGAVCTMPVPRRHPREHPSSWPCRFDPGHPPHRKPLHSEVFMRPRPSRASENVDPASLAGRSVPCRSGTPQSNKLAMPIRSGHPVSLPEQAFCRNPQTALRVPTYAWVAHTPPSANSY